jgi:hypothetical protein
MPPFALTEATKSTSAKQGVSDLLRRSGDSITYPCLVDLLRRGLRNGNWRHLDSGQKALFQCAMWIAKLKGKITNTKLIVQVIEIALSLGRIFQSAIMRAGRKRIAMMRDAYTKPGGVLGWAPQMAQWLNDAGYVWYLGVLEINP